MRPVRKIATKSQPNIITVERPAKASIAEPVTVKDLSTVLCIKSSDIIAKLMAQDVMATANQIINSDIAELVAIALGL